MTLDEKIMRDQFVGQRVAVVCTSGKPHSHQPPGITKARAATTRPQHPRWTDDQAG
jgi:hypothetical protein